MNILHIAPHLGLGVGTVVMGWVGTDIKNVHSVFTLDYMNEKANGFLSDLQIYHGGNMFHAPNKAVRDIISDADIVVLHWWDSAMLHAFLSCELPESRMVFWVHKHYPVPQKEREYPDLFVNVSPIQRHGRHIWSTGDMTRFQAIEPVKHKGFNIGYVGTVDYKKIHPSFALMLHKVGLAIPSARFTIVGEDNVTPLIRAPWVLNTNRYRFTGKVDDVVPYLAEMDVFGYPLREDHYGTCEQVLGEAMCAGVVPVVMANPAERTIVEHGYNGLVSLTENEYVDNVKLLYDNRQLRAELSENAKVFARELYSTETMINEWNKVFSEMMALPKRERAYCETQGSIN